MITLVPKNSFFTLAPRVEVLQPDSARMSVPKPLRLVRQVSQLYSSIRNFRPDLCMTFGEDIAAAATPIAKLAGARGTWNFFRGRPERSINGPKGGLNRLTSRLSDRIFVQTAAGKMALSGFYPPDKLVVWANPIEIPDLTRPPEQREQLIVNIGSIGRLKNQEALVRIFDNIEGQAERWEVTFVGDGPDRSKLEASISASAAASRIRVAGEQQNVAPYLNRAAIFAFTSLSEGFPNALAEAMAAGCACISYDCPTGPSELIDHGVNGFLVEPGDEAEYTRLLQRLIDEPKLREEFSRNARESMKRFEASVVLGRLEEMIEEAIDKKQAQGTRNKDQGKQ